MLQLLQTMNTTFLLGYVYIREQNRSRTWRKHTQAHARTHKARVWVFCSRMYTYPKNKHSENIELIDFQFRFIYWHIRMTSNVIQNLIKSILISMYVLPVFILINNFILLSTSKMARLCTGSAIERQITALCEQRK